MRSDFKVVQEKLQLLENRVQVYQSYDLSRMSLSELNQYYKRFQNTNIACWHYTLLSVLNSRISIQHLKKSLRKTHPNLPSGIQYQYAAGMLPMPDWAGKKLRKKIRCTQKSETYRKQFLKLQDQLVKLLAELFLAAGNRLYEAGSISDVDDVHYLVLKEVLASMENPSIQWKDNRPTWRREAYHWYLNLPNYTEMVLQKKCIGQQKEPLTHMVFPSGSGKTQGRPCMPGLSKGDILIYDGKQPLPEEQAAGKIKPAIVATFIKLIGLAAIFLPIGVMLGYTHEHLIALIVMLGSASTVSCFVMAKNMGHDGTLTSSVVVLTTLFSALTMTGWLFIFRTMGLV